MIKIHKVTICLMRDSGSDTVRYMASVCTEEDHRTIAVAFSQNPHQAFQDVLENLDDWEWEEWTGNFHAQVTEAERNRNG